MTDPTTAARDALLADAKRAIDAPDVFWTLMGRSIDALIATVEAKRSAEVAALVESLRYVQMGLRWAVFKNVPSVERSNEMRDLRDTVDVALARAAASASSVTGAGAVSPSP